MMKTKAKNDERRDQTSLESIKKSFETDLRPMYLLNYLKKRFNIFFSV